MKYNTLSILLKSSIIFVAVLFTACQSDLDDAIIMRAGDPIVFGASIHKNDEVRTRSDEAEADNGLDSTYITSTPYDMNFYIQLCCEQKKEETDEVTTVTDMGIYEVRSGFQGRLWPIDNENALNWKDLTSPHTFYAWNIPWADKKIGTDTDSDADTDINRKSAEPVQIEFHNSSEADGFATYHNDSILKYFIGAKSASYDYKTHGKYVDLTFHHLVSKIVIADLKLIKTDGSIHRDLKADVTFVGMPTEATFYPHPDGNGRPRVKYIQPSPNNGVTYFIDNEPTTEDVFYVCPEVDFSKIVFKVKLKSDDYKNYDTYYGTFDDVKFVREGKAYDQEEKGENGEILDEKILHAGEMMTLNIVLIPGSGPGLSIVISDWSDDKPFEAPYHAYPGIYSDAEVKEVLDAFLGQKNEGGTTKEDIERLFEMYGKEDEDGNKYFPLYDNVDISNTPSGNIFPVPNGYILDGMGHSITMKSNRGYNGDFGDTQTYFNIGSARDVWLTDGTYTIYIDAEGYVWIKNDSEPGGYKRTEHKLEPLVDPYKSYDISCETGIVHRSTYYNNNIVGS